MGERRWWLQRVGLVGLVLGTCTAAAAAPPPQQKLRDIADAVAPGRLYATVRALVGFGTRHTLSITDSKTRGIGAARSWVRAQFAAIGRDCDGCLQIIEPQQMVTGPRIPQPTAVVDVVAVQRGSSDPQRVIVLTGHLDSRVSDVMNATADAPGADDDASGVAAVLEAARVLSRYRFPATIVYAALSGEEQGLYGGKILAAYARDHGWRVETDLNNDIVGSPRGENGVIDNTVVRLFSEGVRANQTPAMAKYLRYEGGELDSPSREIARYAKRVAESVIPNWRVELIYRVDRFGRGGDHEAFNALGFPAVRFTEAAEDYRHQHQDVRVVDGVAYGDTIDHLDFDYLAKVAATNAVTAASLAWAPAPPADLKISGAVTPDTHLSWRAPPSDVPASYRVYWRSTTSPAWTHWRDVGSATSVTLRDVVIDDWFFGVASRSADGFESPVEFPGPVGAFTPAAEPPSDAGG